MVIVELKFSGRTIGTIGETVEYQERTFVAEGHTMDQAVNKAVHKLSAYLSKNESLDA